jgi:hypothetical protein
LILFTWPSDFAGTQAAIREVQLLQSIEAAAAKAIDARYDDIDPA